MTSDDITLIGTIASLAGAGISIWQARSAKKAKTESQIIRKELSEKYDRYDEAQLRNEINTAINKINELKSSLVAELPLSRNYQEVVKMISTVLAGIMSKKIYENDLVRKAVDRSMKLVDTIDDQNIKRILGMILKNLAEVSRHVDVGIRS